MSRISWYLMIHCGEGKQGKRPSVESSSSWHCTLPSLPEDGDVVPRGCISATLAMKCQGTWSHATWRLVHLPCLLHCRALGITEHIHRGEKEAHRTVFTKATGLWQNWQMAWGLTPDVTRIKIWRVRRGGGEANELKQRTLCKLESNNYPFTLHLFQGIVSFIKDQVVLNKTPKVQAVKEKLD